MNVDECQLIRALCNGWPLVWLIDEFDTERKRAIERQSGVYGLGCHAKITRKGLEGSVGDPADPTETEWPVRITWARLRRWITEMPAEIHAEARACRVEWGAICHERADRWIPGKSWPSWQECYEIFGPLTERAAVAVECDERERALRERERALCDRVLTDWAPSDLFDLLPAGAIA